MIDEHERAVALRYHPENGELPEVTAKGRGAIAAQIKAIAAERGIPVQRDGDLVAVLDKLDVGSPIPTVAFAAVAEILAQLYRANAAMPAGAAEPGR
jgi:flagellar biosynthesis protein